jgi:hypothetical protein
MIDLTDRANLLEVVAMLVDAMRRSDPEYTLVHGSEPCSDDDWNTAISAGEDVLEAAEVEY